MKKIILICLLTLHALAIDYSEMSTQELLALIGYVAPENQQAFYRELQLRIPTMTPGERAIYESALQKIQR